MSDYIYDPENTTAGSGDVKDAGGPAQTFTNNEAAAETAPEKASLPGAGYEAPAGAARESAAPENDYRPQRPEPAADDVSAKPQSAGYSAPQGAAPQGPAQQRPEPKYPPQYATRYPESPDRADEPYSAPRRDPSQGYYQQGTEPRFRGEYRPQNPGQSYGGGYNNGGYNGNGYNGGNTAEWSYGTARGAASPQYGERGNGTGYAGANGYFDREEKEKPKTTRAKKEKNSFAAIALALAIISVICSIGSPFLYHLVFAKGASGSGNTASSAEPDTTVLYRSVETTVDKSDMPVIDIANKVSDSVVEITTEFVTTGYFGYGQYINEGAGSGVIISDDGKIITNNHVITGSSNNQTADKITVRLRNGEEYSATLIGRDADSDIAVLKIDAENLSPAVWGDSDALEVGEQIVVVGNPLGELGGTVTTGIVSASDREIKIDDVTMTLIQTDAAVNPGNSGGGMFNGAGELIGIVNAKSSGTGIEGLGFAIPGNDALNVAEQIIEYGYVKGKAYLGISFYEANTGGWFSSETSTILYVYYLEEGYNDDVLKQGDQVLSIDDKEVSSTADVKSILREHEVGDTLTFQILRNNKTMEVEVKCYEYVPSNDDIVFES